MVTYDTKFALDFNLNQDQHTVKHDINSGVSRYYFTVGGLESRSGYEGAYTEPFIYKYIYLPQNEMYT